MKKLLLFSIALLFATLSGWAQSGNILYGVVKGSIPAWGYEPGVIFHYNITTAVQTVDYTFAADETSAEMGNPFGSLVQYGTKYYGMSYSGGTSGLGVLFEWDVATSAYSVKLNFDGTNGANPMGALTFYNGKFYGMTQMGGANNKGIIFEWDPVANVLTKKIDFDGTLKGEWPVADLTLSGNVFYGMTLAGGTRGDGYDNGGVLFKWEPATNSFTKLFDFGYDNMGTPSNFADDIEWGFAPNGNVTVYNGKLYGLTQGGGYNSNETSAGVLFEYNLTTNTYTRKVKFDQSAIIGGYPMGHIPKGSLTLYNNKFYGTTYNGGIDGAGILFEWNPSSNAYTQRKYFDWNLGGQPFGGAMTVCNGKLYGMTSNSNTGWGVTYEYNPATYAYAELFEFQADGSNGYAPEQNSLVVYKPVHNITQGNDYSGIQLAITAANAGDVILVDAGTYPELLTITKALTINGSDGAVLDGTTLGLEKVGVKIKSGDVTFNNIDVAHFSGNGIIVGYEASIPGSLKNVHITNCKISGIQPGYSHGFGIYVGYESEAFKYSPPKLTAHLDYSGLLIENNEITDSRSSSVVLQSITGTPGTLMVRNNYIHDNDNDGIWIDCARNINIEDNTVTNNLDGIYISSYGDAFLYKWVYDWNNQQLNGPYGPMNISITGNAIEDNNTAGGVYLQAGYPATMLINENVITGNVPEGFANYLSEVVNATCNWWGSISPCVIAPKISGPVTFSPWLVSGTDTYPGTPGFQPAPGTCTGVDVPVTVSIAASTTEFCSDIALTANPSPDPSPIGTYTYEWKFGTSPTWVVVGNDQTLTLSNGDSDGDYTVIVTDGCHTATATYNYQKQALVSSYTILGFQEVKLTEKIYVETGSVGATNSAGKITVGKNSTIAGPGAFAKATTITVDPTANVPLKYYSPAVVTLPVMQYGATATGSNLKVPDNTTQSYAGNYKDVTIGKNCNVTFTTGTIFGKLTVGNGSDVRFEATPTLDFTKITMGEITTLEFNGDVSVRTKDDVVIGKSSVVNGAGHKVVFYIDGGAGNFFQVKAGGNTNVTASVYVPIGNIIVEGNKDKNTYMTGFYIANTVTTKDKNIYFNSFDCTTQPSMPLVIGSNADVTGLEENTTIAGNLEVTVFPNPATTCFNLKIKAGSTEEVQIRIFDLMGRMVQQTKGTPQEILRIGDQLMGGTYIMEVRQCSEIVKVKLIRQ